MKRSYSFFFLTLLSLASCGEGSVDNLKVTRESRLSEEQKTYLTNDDPSNTSPYNGNMSKSAPNPIRLSWEGKNIDRYKISITKENVATYTYETENQFFDFYNDEFNVNYSWSVSDLDNNHLTSGESFKYEPTLSQPRNLNIEGVENVRDIGGWGKVVDNQYKTYMKQGMLYRSGRFNEDKANPINVTISDNGIYELKNHLKIKTEIDLRRSSNNEVGSIKSSPLGDDVTYKNLPMYYGGNNILTFVGTAPNDPYEYNNPLMIKEFFKLLTDNSNYPIVFHCSIGKDRTGCLAYLIEGLMGFDQEIMYRDYMFTNFADAGMCKLKDDIINRYGTTLNDYSGDSLQEKVYNYLNVEIGLSTSELDQIIDILKA